jgi:predicted  nucleic acid-binding Zn-ribbon protein
MAQQIKKKFIKNDAIDGSKIKLLEGESIRIDSPAGEIELLKLGENGELISDGKEVAFKSQVDALEAELQTEEQARIDGDSQLAASLESEVSRATSSEEALDSKIDQEISDRSQAMSAEESARISGDENLQNQINNILSNVDPAALDSLTEIVSAFQGADSDLQGTISALSASAASALAEEVSDRQAADQVLQSNIDTEESERIAADGVLQSNIDSEESARESADLVLQGNIDSEAFAREAADIVLQANVDDEEAARIAADVVLQGNIDAEEARAMGVESSLQSQVTQEVADRTAGDASLQASIDDLDGYAQEVRSDLDQEILDRQAADSSIQSSVTAEQERATSVETSLQSQVTQEVADRISGDANLQSQIDALNDNFATDQELAAAVSSLESQIQSGDSALQSSITDLEGVVQGNFDLQQSDIDGLRSDVDALVVSDANLQSQIDAEKSRLDAILSASDADKDSFKEIVDLINSVDTENDQAFAGYVLSNNEAVNLKADISYVDSEVSDLQDIIGIEESARIAGDSALQSQIDGLQPRVEELESAVEALQEYKEVLEFGDISSFPEQGVPSKVYVSKDSNKLYRYEEGQESGGGLDLPAMPSAPQLTVTTSITSADDLQATINAASDGDVIFLANGTYSLAANLSISKQVALVGESQAGVLIQDTRGNSQSFVSVSVDNVTLKDLTVRHVTSDSNIGHAITVSGAGFPQVRLNNFRMYNVKSQYSKGGLSIRSDNFVVDGCTFEVVAGSSTRRGILHYGNGGDSFIKNSHFINATTAALRAITPTSTSGTNPSDNQAGSLTIEGSTFTGNLSQFVNMDNHQGAAGSFELIIKDNVTPETNAFVVSFGAAANFGDVFSRIVMVGNTLTNNHSSGLGKGALAIDGIGGIAYRSSVLPVISTGNTLGQLLFRSGYAEAIGSTGSLVGYNSTSITQPTVEVSEGSSSEVSAGSYIELSPTIDQDLSSLQSAIDDEQARAMGVESGLDSRLTSAESDIDSLESRMDMAEGAIDAVESRMTAAESDIDSLEARVTENESDISVLQSQVLNVESDVSSLKTRMTTAESDISSLETAITSEVSRAQSAEEALDARVDVLEARAFGKQKVVIRQELSFIELEREVVANSLVVCVNRLSVHKDEDYTVSVVGGKTRLTWINSFANPDGEEKIEEGDNIFVTFYY